MSGLIPEFNWREVVVQPWTQDLALTGWVMLMGFLVAAACGLVGNYLLLRRMALVGDAISHSILPGLVVAFLVFRHANTWIMFGGALAAGFVTVVLIEFIHKQSRVKPDAAICISFTTLFAIGVAMMSVLETAGTFHIDAECVLYGEIAFVGLEPPVVVNGIELAPPSVMRMGLVFLGIVACVILFYKELLVTSFDPGLARSMGIRPTLWHYGRMAALALVVVSAFEAVGAILAVAMLIVPPMTAAQITQRLPARLVVTVAHALASAVIGYHLSVWWRCSAAGAMVVAGAGLFVIAWLGTAIRTVLGRRNAAASAPVGATMES